MKDKLLNNRDKWCRSIFVTILAGAAAEIVFVLYGTIWGGRESSQFVPWTFHTVWEIAALVGFAYTVKRCTVNLSAYIVYLLLGVILASIAWMCIPNSVKTLDPNYYGVESRISMETHEEGRDEERVEYDYPLTCGLLYRRGDPNLKRAIDEAMSCNEYVSTEGFLFWQTGLARGFSPIGISGYNGVMEYIIESSCVLPLARW
ncbi:MAG: hypothetical protein PHR28_08975 [candidate division Zixibacteria bacterium]|nr:hypothetical protein [candidate division Zixibacteria bacterium]